MISDNIFIKHKTHKSYQGLHNKKSGSMFSYFPDSVGRMFNLFIDIQKGPLTLECKCFWGTCRS